MIYVMKFVPFNLRFICVVYKNTERLSWMDSQLAQDWWVSGRAWGAWRPEPEKLHNRPGRMVGDYLCYVWVDNLRSIPGGGKIDNWCGNEFPRFSPLRLCLSQQKKSLTRWNNETVGALLDRNISTLSTPATFSAFCEQLSGHRSGFLATPLRNWHSGAQKTWIIGFSLCLAACSMFFATAQNR